MAIEKFNDEKELYEFIASEQEVNVFFNSHVRN